MNFYRKIRRASVIIIAWAMLCAVSASAHAQSLTTEATHAILMDFETGDVMFEKNADAPMKPASMAKLMTAYILFSRVKSGEIGMEDTFTVSRKAYRMGGSRMFLEANSQAGVADLMRGIIVQSGNDASVVVAEALGGSEDIFAQEMTRVARNLGMTATVFGNATGWPDEVTTTTARDIAVLARALITEFPELYKIYSEKEFIYNDIKQGNRNPLLYTLDYADGLKTGYTEESGYGLAASAALRDRRVIMVVNGLTSKKQRSDESTRLMTLAFSGFRKYTLMDVAEPMGFAPVAGGIEQNVPVHASETITRIMLPADYAEVVREVNLLPDLTAPIAEGAKIGEVVFTIGDKTQRYPVVAGTRVRKLPFYLRAKRYIEVLIFGPEALPQAE